MLVRGNGLATTSTMAEEARREEDEEEEGNVAVERRRRQCCGGIRRTMVVVCLRKKNCSHRRWKHRRKSSNGRGGERFLFRGGEVEQRKSASVSRFLKFKMGYCLGSPLNRGNNTLTTSIKIETEA
ncbi:hypothetical protein LR48_Vigan07g112900 [Vigna angularis]|uniref:Uncharacterized protein n=1 Tax=Phaseolus angularis TaxID=3914 RepID=A0A0L9UX46_PHAAN|nr:uncharacterized protein HKW66_Vig0126790 [Vigna angularis]KOM47425.1 hypothetical protein LR48_Vigan07g112900 [Vigna angularis]